MKRVVWLVMTIALGLGLACAPSAAGGGKAPAFSLNVGPPAFHDPEILVAKSMPPQFEIHFTRDMPTPGWRLVVDSVEADEETGRIVARVSEIAPEGMQSQVITATQFRIPLGKLVKGKYLLEIRLRRGTQGPHGLVQAVVLNAR